MPMHVLEYECPGLSLKIRELSPDERRRRLTSAMVSAARQIKELDECLREVLSQLSRESSLRLEQLADLRAYSDAADVKYFELHQQGLAELSRLWFYKARLAAAMVSLFTGESWHEAADAAYELVFVGADRHANEALVRTVIESRRESDGPPPGLDAVRSADAVVGNPSSVTPAPPDRAEGGFEVTGELRRVEDR